MSTCDCDDCTDAGYKPDRKMNPDVKAKWLAALRSGEYAQTTGVLNRLTPLFDEGLNKTVPAGHCCLGVLCEVGVADGVVEKSPGYGNWSSFRWAAPDGGGEDAMPTIEILDWAGVGSRTADHLAEMNDSGKASFQDIANWIERNL